MLKLFLKSLVKALFLNDISVYAFKLLSFNRQLEYPEKTLEFKFANDTELCYLSSDYDKTFGFCSGYQKFNREYTPSGLLWQNSIDIIYTDPLNPTVNIDLILNLQFERTVVWLP